MKLIKILILLSIIALGNCVSNFNYTRDSKNPNFRLKKTVFKSQFKNNSSFIEMNLKTEYKSGGRINMFNSDKSQEEANYKIKVNTSSRLNTEIKNEESSERRIKTKLKTKYLKYLTKTNSKVSSTIKSKAKTLAQLKSMSKTKFIPLIFVAILVTAFIAKTIFTYVERKYKEKAVRLLKEQIAQLSYDENTMKSNEIQSCTFTSLILASNKDIIMLYKLKIIYIRAYMLNYNTFECEAKKCVDEVDEFKKYKCIIEKAQCKSFLEVKPKFEEIHKKVEVGIDHNIKILRGINSNSCDQSTFYRNIQDKVLELENQLEDLEEDLANNVDNIAEGAAKTCFNSVLLSLWSNDAFTSASFFRDKNRAIEFTAENAFRVTRMTFLEKPITTLDNLTVEIKNFKNSFETKKPKQTDTKKIEKKYSAIYESVNLLGETMKEKLPESDTNKLVNILDNSPGLKNLTDEEKNKVQINQKFISEKKDLQRHLSNLIFARSIINSVRMVFSFLRLFDIAMGGLSLFTFIEGILEVICRILNVAIAHIDYNMLDEKEKVKKTRIYKLKRKELFNAWAQLSFSFLYLTFFPISVILKGTYDAIVKLTDMISAIKQVSHLEIQMKYDQELGNVKRKHSELFRTYNICEAKFYGQLNILTVVNTIIKDEMDMIKNDRINSYKNFLNIVTGTKESKDFIKNEIIKLCSENIQFCSHTLSEKFLKEEINFSPIEILKFKKEAIYGPYSKFAVARSLEEFKSFINIGYEPISATDHFRPGKATGYTDDELKILDEREKDNNMIMGCRLCSKSSVIRHVEIVEDGKTDNLFEIYKKRNSSVTENCSEPDDKIICKCIYKDPVCLTKNIKTIRISLNKVLYYETVSRRVKGNSESASYPGLDKLLLWWRTFRVVTDYNNKLKNDLFLLNSNVGIWNSVDKDWSDECPESMCIRGQETKYILNSYTRSISENKYLHFVYSASNKCTQPHIMYKIVPFEFYFLSNKGNDDYSNPDKSMCLKYLYLLNSNSAQWINNSEIKTDKVLNPLKYNWIYYGNKFSENLLYRSSNFNPDFADHIETGTAYGSLINHISFSPFNPKTMKFTKFVKKLKKECQEICDAKEKDPYDFKTCPNNKMNYNYIVNKSYYSGINEEDPKSYMKVLNLNAQGNPKFNDLSYSHYFQIQGLTTKIIDLTQVNDESNYTQFINNSIKESESFHLIKIPINLSKTPYLPRYVTFKKTSDKKVSVEFNNNLNDITPEILSFDMTKIVNQIFVIVMLNELTTTNQDYITLEANGWEIMRMPGDFTYRYTFLGITLDRSFKVYIFTKPLPEMGIIKTKIFGKKECILNYMNNLKENNIFNINETHFTFSIKNSNHYDENLFNYVNLEKLKVHSGFIKQLKTYHPFDLFNFNSELGNSIFNNGKCKKKNFSFSIPIKFHDDDTKDKNIYYRRLLINKNNQIIESYSIAGPNVGEIYWIQFTKIQGYVAEEITSSDKVGYFPYYSFEYDYFLNAKDTIYWQKWQKNFNNKAEYRKIYITIWISYDYRHRYNQEDLCEKCRNNDILLNEYDIFIKSQQNKKILPLDFFRTEGLYLTDKRATNYRSIIEQNFLPQCDMGYCEFAKFLNKYRTNPKKIINLPKISGIFYFTF